MNILVDLGHPGHVHFFRNPAAIWRERGHRVLYTSRDMPIVARLLAAQGDTALVIGRRRPGAAGLALELARRTLALVPLLVRERVDACAAIGGALTAPAARLAGRPCVVFDDTDTAGLENRVSHPLASVIATPQGYPRDLGSKQVRYPGLHELSYMHPARFAPDPAAPARYGLDPGAGYAVVRFSSWEAGHDLTARTASLETKLELVRLLQGRGRVLVVPEGNPPEELRPLAPAIAPEDFHHILAFARHVVTEGATTASEACILGVPALYMNPSRPFYIFELARAGLLDAGLPGQDDLPALLRAQLERFADPATGRELARAFTSGRADVALFAADLVEGAARRA
ncbi:hypothetical protein NNJEOMEG_02030 [Fundidesulfovibrio magnetotacticus]|uniref:DUF354 domain-containing protein n=1 Tax=Fundidesulfovibrio magnetotacticus TaxID=2730080 RepID=A0A6V8LTC3_9BACT|nr:DUF354 domain-containing protein [Fundidesulfovibrio magnetotacticus]GFK94190.1 hypothetical protein NNJEOMEG_02030 [Fundidesulfovibrio magnetotacticus]